MTQTHPQFDRRPVGAVSLLRGGLALELSPCARSAQDRHPLPCREDLVASRDRTRRPASRPSPSSAGTTRHGASTTTRSAPCAAPCARTAARSPWPRPSPSGFILQYRDHPHWSYQLHYDNLAALVKADPSLGPLRSYSTVRRYMQAHGLVRKPRPQPNERPGEARRGKETPDARDPQLRSRVRRVAVASRFPPRIAQGAHSRRPVAAPDRAGHPRRPLATLLPRPVVPLGDRRGPGARTLPGDPETRSATCALDR